MREYIRRIGGLSIGWPKVFELCASDAEARAAFDALLLLTKDDIPAERAEKFYTLILEQYESLFSGATQEVMRSRKRVRGSARVDDATFAPPIRVVGKLVR